MKFSLPHRRRRVFSFFYFRPSFSRFSNIFFYFSDFIEASRVKNIELPHEHLLNLEVGEALFVVSRLDSTGAKEHKSDRSRQELSNECSIIHY